MVAACSGSFANIVHAPSFPLFLTKVRGITIWKIFELTNARTGEFLVHFGRKNQHLDARDFVLETFESDSC